MSFQVEFELKITTQEGPGTKKIARVPLSLSDSQINLLEKTPRHAISQNGLSESALVNFLPHIAERVRMRRPIFLAPWPKDYQREEFTGAVIYCREPSLNTGWVSWDTVDILVEFLLRGEEKEDLRKAVNQALREGVNVIFEP